MDEELEFAYKKKKNNRKLLGCIVKIFVLVVIFLVGFLIGYFVKKPGKANGRDQFDKAALNAKFHAAFQDEVSAEKLEEYARLVILFLYIFWRF